MSEESGNDRSKEKLGAGAPPEAAPEAPSNEGERERSEEVPARPLSRGDRIQEERRRKAEEKRRAREAREAERAASAASGAPDAMEARATAVAEQARDATQAFLRTHGRSLGLVAALVLVISLAIVIGKEVAAGGAAGRAESLAEAEAIASASERSAALVEVASENQGREVAEWALLGAASAALEAGDAKEAASLYERALAEKDLRDYERGLALEGLAAAQIAAGELGDAKTSYERLRELGDGARNTADLGIARLLLAEGRQDEAEALLIELRDRLSALGREGVGYTQNAVMALLPSEER